MFKPLAVALALSAPVSMAGCANEASDTGAPLDDTPDAVVASDTPSSTGDADSGTPDSAADALVWPTVAPDNRAAFIWRGMDHEWLRNFLGFRVPHRISKLDSYIDDESHSGAPWVGSASFNFGQVTGVDGNYMKPTGYYSAFRAPDIYVSRGNLRLRWTDDVQPGDYPKAMSSLEETITIDLAAAELAHGLGDTYGAVLRGLELRTSCDDAKQPPDEPCNSDGLWPYRFYIAISECSRSAEVLSCPLRVEIHRAWTPNKGGISGIEEKPLNDKLDYDLRVHYTIVGGADSALALSYGSQVVSTARLRDNGAQTGSAVITGPRGTYRGATVGLVAFGFQLDRMSSQSGDKFGHLGRYLDKVHYRVDDDGYDPDSGELAYDYQTHVHCPDTVANADVTYYHRAVSIQLGAADHQIATEGTATGSLCVNSSDQAPAFSVWKQCDDDDKGPPQSEDSQLIPAP